MSYCRFSSDDYACMLYVYESDRGYEVHVANTKALGDVPKVPSFEEWEDVGYEKVLEAMNKQSEYLQACKREQIGLPHDGESFVEDTLGDLLARVAMLRDAGYHVPDFVFDQIQEEIDEERSA